ncbi:phasin family protein [Sporolactobacillus putidus]|uniref:Polyhydroxyalkanoate synthesis regulator phasin n=1 Tax=Sporolactobacillus putidus TaxID=492735 RepID=A0A917W4N0_9BACL|nr:hypothetical protein [Sporolactobacillus putidus]GGL62225.1 hypothetical protein GCM10007968_27760 [Sporolactobacillus putidus]
MNDLIKKSFFIGLGATLASKEKADKFLSDLSKSGSAAAEEVKSFLDALNDKGKTKKEQWQNDIREDIKDTIRDLGFVTSEEYNKLKEKLEALEAKLSNDPNEASEQETEK